MRVVAVTLALLSFFLATAGTASASDGCWKQLVNDFWTDGRVDRTYPTSCYREAIAKLPPDVQHYSDAEESLRRALADAIHDRFEDDGGAGGAAEGTNAADAAAVDEEAPRGFFEQAIDRVGSKNADSIPIPIVVLAVLAILLLGSAGIGRLHG